MKIFFSLVAALLLVLFGASLTFVLLPYLMPAPDMGMMGMGDMPPPAVNAVEMTMSPVDSRDEFIGTVEPVRQVMVRSEVAGYIDATHFVEGSLVEEGDLLFTVDQKKFRSQVGADEAMLESAKAELNRANKFLDRLEGAGLSVSQTDLDTALSAQLQAQAIMKQAEANLNLARLDLSYSEIRSPISGRIGAAMITKGNYVSSASGELARIVQVNPIRVVFSMTDRAYLDARAKALGGDTDQLVAQVRLPNDVMLPTIGQFEFTDNAMNTRTGTMAARYLFDNPDEMLVAGGYVNIMLGKPDRPMGLRLPSRAVLIDPDGSYALTVNEEGLVGMARMTLGDTLEGDVIVTDGLKVGDRVIVDGVQKVQPGAPATVTLVEAAQ